jgi:antitoxin CptB
METLPADAGQGRLVWRCRRGMKELDLLLTTYLRDGWIRAGSAERAAFERILDLPDPLLAAYLMQRESPSDPDLESLLAILRGQVAGRLPVSGSPAGTSGAPGT